MEESVKTMSNAEARRSIEESLKRILAAQETMFATVLAKKDDLSPDSARTLEEVTSELRESLTLPGKTTAGGTRHRRQNRRRSTRKFRK
jgi:hypothetical protein